MTPEERQSIRASAEVMILNLDDGTVTPVTQNDFYDSDASWNRDGSEIYYYRNNGRNKTLFRQHLGETDATAIAEGDFISNRGFVFRPVLSPNGRFLAYHKEVNGLYGIYVYDLELDRERRVVGASAER